MTDKAPGGEPDEVKLARRYAATTKETTNELEAARRVFRGCVEHIDLLRAQLAAAEKERDAKWYECPDCCFRYDAVHVFSDGSYKCPVCNEAELESRAAAAEGAMTKAKQESGE